MSSGSFVPRPSAATPAVAMPTFLRVREVMRVTGLARSTLYKMMAEQCFPAPCRLGSRAVGWRVDDVAQWSRSRPAARDCAPATLSAGVR